jgi:polysaccharide biosynthesis protein PslH
MTCRSDRSQIAVIRLSRVRTLNGARAPIAYIAHNFETQVSAAIARNFRGSLFRKAALHANAWKVAKAEVELCTGRGSYRGHTAEDSNSLENLSPLSAKLVLPPAYRGSRVSDRQIVQATPRRVAVVGNYRWMAKQINLSACLEAADPVMQDAGIGIDIVGEVPDSFRKAWETRVKATRFHGFVEDLGNFLAERRMGLVIEETGGGFKNKILEYVFNRLPIAAIKDSMTGLPMIPGLDYL